MLVFLKTYEEANCTMDGDCKFSFTSNVPETTGVALAWNEPSLSWEVTVTATGVTGTKDNTELYIDGFNQETKAVTSTSAVFKVSNTLSE